MSPAETVARNLLRRELPKFCYDLVSDEEVRAGLSLHYPGHVLQDVIEDRARILTKEVDRVQVVVTEVLRVIDVAIEKLDQ